MNSKAVVSVSVVEETQAAVDASPHITGADAGAVATLLHIAGQIDAQTNGLTPDGKLDNVSVPTYLKYCDALGLTPVARLRFKDEVKEGSSGKLAHLRDVTGRKAG